MPKTHKAYSVGPALANSQIAGHNPNRTALIICCAAVSVFVGLGTDATNAPEFVVMVGNGPLVLTRELLGDNITKAINVTTVGGASGIITEVSGE